MGFLPTRINDGVYFFGGSFVKRFAPVSYKSWQKSDEGEDEEKRGGSSVSRGWEITSFRALRDAVSHGGALAYVFLKQKDGTSFQRENSWKSGPADSVSRADSKSVVLPTSCIMQQKIVR